MEKKPKTKSARKNFNAKGTNSRTKYDEREQKRSVHNDPNWYLSNGQLAKDVANFSFNLATGDTINVDPDILTGSGLSGSSLRMPGICAISTGPSVGVSSGPTAPINVAAKDIYSFVRHANSGHANYDTPDLMLYLLAADSVQTYWSYMVRIYGIARVFSQVNRYIGDALLTAMGVNPGDIRANMAQFRAYINQFAIKANVLAVPNTMSYFIRHQWMYQNVYMDEDNPKAQLYLYVPAYVYKYAIDAETSAGTLVPEWLTYYEQANGVMTLNASMDFATLRLHGDNLIDAMLSQEDVGIMSGDILKAYGSDKLYRFAQISEDFAIAPVYSEEVLEQFHNTDFVGNYLAIATTQESTSVAQLNAQEALTIRQRTDIGGGDLIINPLVVGWLPAAYDKFLDFWKQDITPEMCLVASRNKIHARLISYGVIAKTGSSVANAKAMGLVSCGSELCFDAHIYHYDSLTGLLTQVSVMPSSATGSSYNGAAVGLASKFNQFPLLQGVSFGLLNMPVGEISNFTVLNGTEIDAMHNTALMSLLGVPYRW